MELDPCMAFRPAGRPDPFTGPSIVKDFRLIGQFFRFFLCPFAPRPEEKPEHSGVSFEKPRIRRLPAFRC
jgi:hypothetical protein